MKSTDEKFSTVIDKNTFYYFNKQFEGNYEGYINSIQVLLENLRNEIEINGFKNQIFENFLEKNEYGLTALLALTGFSDESLKRIITIIRIVDDPSLSRLTYKSNWCQTECVENLIEWNDGQIAKKVKENKYFRAGLINLFLEGSSVPYLVETFPLFELKKLSISKLKFKIPAMIDTLIRYKEKGSYSAKRENNPEKVIAELITKLNLKYEKGDLGQLVTNASQTKRTMDFIIPNKINPTVIIECSFLVTTSSGQGDKSKTEIAVANLLRQHYPNSKFIGFVDGVGWYVRKEDLRRMVSAYEDVFTFHKDEFIRFENFLREEFNIND